MARRSAFSNVDIDIDEDLLEERLVEQVTDSAIESRSTVFSYWKRERGC